MAYNYKKRYWSDPEFREKEKIRHKVYKKGKGKIVALKNAMNYQNSEHGFITVVISAVFKPSACRKRGLWPAMTKPQVWKELDKHILEMKKKFPESDGRLCIYCENSWIYNVHTGPGKR